MATTYLNSHKRADKRTALQSLKDRFDSGLNPEKLGAVSSYLCDPAGVPPRRGDGGGGQPHRL